MLDCMFLWNEPKVGLDVVANIADYGYMYPQFMLVVSVLLFDISGDETPIITDY